MTAMNTAADKNMVINFRIIWLAVNDNLKVSANKHETFCIKQPAEPCGAEAMLGWNPTKNLRR